MKMWHLTFGCSLNHLWEKQKSIKHYRVFQKIKQKYLKEIMKSDKIYEIMICYACNKGILDKRSKEGS